MAENLTEQQKEAVWNRGGKLLVSAAAGSGKTRVLVERLLAYVEQEGRDIDEFLVITSLFLRVLKGFPEFLCGYRLLPDLFITEALFKMTGLSVITPAAGVDIRRAPVGVGIDVTGRHFGCDLLQSLHHFPGEFTHLLGSDQIVTFQFARFVDLQGQEARRALPPVFHGTQNLFLVQNQSVTAQQIISLFPVFTVSRTS